MVETNFSEMLTLWSLVNQGVFSVALDMKTQHKSYRLAIWIVQDSFATHCPNPWSQIHHPDVLPLSIIPNETYVDACLEDLLTVSWLKLTEHDASIVTIREQLDYTKNVEA